MIVNIGITKQHFLPVSIIDNTALIMSKIKEKSIIFSTRIPIEYNELIKYVKIQFVNTLRNNLVVQFLKVNFNLKLIYFSLPFKIIFFLSNKNIF